MKKRQKKKNKKKLLAKSKALWPEECTPKYLEELRASGLLGAQTGDAWREYAMQYFGMPACYLEGKEINRRTAEAAQRQFLRDLGAGK